MGGEVGAGVAALDEAGAIVAHDHLLALAVHLGVAKRWCHRVRGRELRARTPGSGRQPRYLECFRSSFLLNFCDNSGKEQVNSAVVTFRALVPALC